MTSENFKELWLTARSQGISEKPIRPDAQASFESDRKAQV